MKLPAAFAEAYPDVAGRFPAFTYRATAGIGKRLASCKPLFLLDANGEWWYVNAQRYCYRLHAVMVDGDPWGRHYRMLDEVPGMADKSKTLTKSKTRP